MGQKQGKKAKDAAMPEISEELLDSYIRSEFRAMDDDKDGKLNRQQLLDLLILLGYSKGKEKLKKFHVKSEDEVELEDYVTNFKSDKELIQKTSKFRVLFKMFDKDNDGTATKEEMRTGLDDLNIKVDEGLKKTIEKMDANADGKITYEEFLTMEFKIALRKTDADANADGDTKKEETE